MKDIPATSRVYNDKKVAFGSATFRVPYNRNGTAMATTDKLFVCSIQIVSLNDKNEPETFILNGSAFFIAEGVAISAKHIFDEYLPTDLSGTIYSDASVEIHLIYFDPVKRDNAGIFPVEIITTTSFNSDIVILSCCSSKDNSPMLIPTAILSSVAPAVGDRLHAMGLVQTSYNFEDHSVYHKYNYYLGKGIVTDTFPNGRDRQVPSSCVQFETFMPSGTSGGPVFNEDGCVVGLISTSIGDKHHSILTLIFTGSTCASLLLGIGDQSVNTKWYTKKPINYQIRDLPLFLVR